MPRRILWWLIAGAVVVGAGAWALRPDRLAVDTAEVTIGPLQVTIDEDGLTRMAHHAEIAAPVNGRLRETALEPGDSVARGSVVGELTPAPLDPRARAEAEAAVASARSLQLAARAVVQQAALALDEARRARGRAERLRAAGAIADKELEDAVADERMRARELDAAHAREAAALQDERRAQAALLAADPSRRGRASTITLRSPIAGKVLRVFQEHDRVVPAGTLLIAVGDPRSLEIVSDVLSRDAVGISPGMPMRIRVSGGDTLPAEVSRVEPAAFTRLSPLGVEEQRVNVIARLLQDVVGLGDGFEVDVSIVLWEADSVLKVPATALVPVDSGWGVFVVDGGRARLRAVDVGRRGTREAQVTRGLTAGMRVILHPDERLSDGTRVRAIS
jgi:HlyD family secretion protein